MAKSNTPGNPSWEEVSENLRGLQDRISSHQGRFRDTGRNDTAEDLEKCIQLLHGAQITAMEFDSSSHGARGTQKRSRYVFDFGPAFPPGEVPVAQLSRRAPNSS